jgi:hypothetical protein
MIHVICTKLELVKLKGCTCELKGQTKVRGARTSMGINFVFILEVKECMIGSFLQC